MSARAMIGTSSFCLIFGLILIIVTAATLKYNALSSTTAETDTDNPDAFIHAAVSSGNTDCNQVGANIMKEGGNAVDAAIATALCIGVKNPFASGIGGGGIFMLHFPNGTDMAIDCREVAPASASTYMYRQNPFLSVRGGLAIGIPGELQCLDYVFKNFGSIALGTGSMGWPRLFYDAINFAQNGYTVTPFLESKIWANTSVIFNDPGMSSVWINATTGLPLKAGDTVKMPLLANTLQLIATNGIQTFYSGPLAQQIIREINGFGGNVTSLDFANYTLQFPGYYSTTYRGYRVVTAPLPFSGGIMLCQTLNILEKIPLSQNYSFSAPAIHVVTEAMKFGFGNRVVFGDPYLQNQTSDIQQMLDKSYAQNTLFPSIRPSQVYPSALDYINLADDSGITNRKRRSKENIIFPPGGQGTTHISIVDPYRMAVAFTTTINWSWGAGVIGTSTGILYNNEMDDFSMPNAPGTTPPTGQIPTDPHNFPGPGKRPLSSMTPTFIYDSQNRLVMVVGGAGGPKIFSGTLNTIINVLDFKINVKESAKLPRYHNQLNPNVLLYDSFLPTDEVNQLVFYGHVNQSATVPFNYINIISLVYSPKGNSTLDADSDWRKAAISAGY